jgi:hypothetical protein
VSVALLLAGCGSTAGAWTWADAVLSSEPVAAGDRVALTSRRRLDPTGIDATKSGLPLPLAGQVAPPPGLHVHAAPSRFGDRLSSTRTCGASLGPAFRTSIWYPAAVPATMLFTPSVLVMLTSGRRSTSVCTLAL